MIAVVFWYLLVTLVGWLTLPIAFRFLRFLPDRGYTLSRSLGLLVWGFIFWLLTSFRISQNDPGGVLFALLLLGGLGLWLNRNGWVELRIWLKDHKPLILTTELLFIGAFVAWALVRAANPNITFTEKPMELAFINSIVRSPQFPPNDPWLSGYAISYYYFGYILISMLIQLSGVVSHVAFNVAVAMWFALTALGGFGILYNLLYTFFKQVIHPNQKNHKEDIKEDSAEAEVSSTGVGSFDGGIRKLDPGRIQRRAAGWALLAPLLILLVSNLAGILDVFHSKGIFWSQDAEGQWQSGFWSWVGIKEFDEPPPKPFDWIPSRSHWLWWRASRVIQDRNLLNQPEEVINEFPFFSYLLADLHPHVLGMPFVLLATGLALNLYNSGSRRRFGPVSPRKWVRKPEFWLAAVVLGGLAFMNTWDFPIYVALYSSVYALVRYRQMGWNLGRVGDFISVGLLMGVTGGLLYLPFYVGFASQAGGLLPSLIFHTRGIQFWVMFAPLILPIFAWLVFLRNRKDQGVDLRHGLIKAAVIVGGLWGLMAAAAGLIQVGDLVAQGLMGSANSRISEIGFTINSLAGMYFGKQGGSFDDLMATSILRRLLSPGTWLTLWLMLSLVISHLRVRPIADEDSPEAILSENDQNADQPKGFVLLLVLTGIGLTLVPEFFYLQDGFGTRMNTIFKFYIQAWMVWGLAAAYASAVLFSELSGRSRLVFRTGWSLLIVVALVYPILMLPIKIQQDSLKPFELNLDGKAYLARISPDEWQAFMFLKDAPLGVVVEAVGPQYHPDFARVSTHTGQPTVLGWEGHQVQWRGGGREMGTRRSDIDLLYHTTHWEQAREVLVKYNIRYVYIGPIERNTYRVSEQKFINHLNPIFINASVVIYEVPDQFRTPILTLN